MAGGGEKIVLLLLDGTRDCPQMGISQSRFSAMDTVVVGGGTIKSGKGDCDHRLGWKKEAHHVLSCLLFDALQL